MISEQEDTKADTLSGVSKSILRSPGLLSNGSSKIPKILSSKSDATDENQDSKPRPIHHHQAPNLRTFLCGACAGVAAKTTIAPAERVKITFQVTPKKFTWRGALRTGISTYQRDGIFGLWRGHSMSVARVIPYAGLSYWFHDQAEHLLRLAAAERARHHKPPARVRSTDKNKSDKQSNEQATHTGDATTAPVSVVSGYDAPLSGVEKFIAGAVAGAGGTIFTYPLDVMRVRLAMGDNLPTALRAGHWYAGVLPTLLGIVPYAGVTWTTKQTVSEIYTHYAHVPVPPVNHAIFINAFAG